MNEALISSKGSGAIPDVKLHPIKGIVWSSVLVALFAMAVSPVTGAPQKKIDLVKYTEPNQIFTLDRPAEWYVLAVPNVGQRSFIFSKQKRTAQDLTKAYKPEAELRIKLFRLNQDDMKMTREALVKRYMQYLTQVYKQLHFSLSYKIEEDQEISDRAASRVATYCKGTETDIWITTANGIFVKLTANYDSTVKQEAQPLLERMARSFQLLPSPKPLSLVPFDIGIGDIHLQVPKKWHVNLWRQKSLAQFFISREKISKPKDMFEVGITINVFKDVTKTWGKQGVSAGNFLSLWTKTFFKQTTDMHGKIFVFKTLDISGLPATFMERSYPYQGGCLNGFIQEYHVSVMHGVTLIDMVLEAPVMEFENYRPTFDAIIKSLQNPGK